MDYLPLDKKSLIQSLYVRFRELAKEIPAVDKRVTTAEYALWGGLIIAVLSLTRALIRDDGVSGVLGGIGLLVFLASWAFKHDEGKKQQALWSERHAIWKQMEDIGVHFSGAPDRVTVYTGSIAHGNEVSPLDDGAYR